MPKLEAEAMFGTFKPVPLCHSCKVRVEKDRELRFVHGLYSSGSLLPGAVVLRDRLRVRSKFMAEESEQVIMKVIARYAWVQGILPLPFFPTLSLAYCENLSL